jgi:ATP-binding cassette subfamily B protein
MPEQEQSPGQRINVESLELEFRNVSFKYPESDRYILRNISFSVKSSQKLAIVGQNGAGKTTITRLINKFYQPTSGVILVNGVNLQHIDTIWWRSVVSNLSQDVPKYFLPVKENIVIGDHNHTFDLKRYKASVAEAMVKEDIGHLPQKDKTMLGKFFSHGVNLSGGQWQKLSIARSFYRRAPLLILDEPTSAVDSKAEQEIFNAIFDRNSNQAQLIISHKFSNIRRANYIIVLARGKIIERGNHKELMEANGEYARLYTQQSAAFVDS